MELRDDLVLVLTPAMRYYKDFMRRLRTEARARYNFRPVMRWYDVRGMGACMFVDVGPRHHWWSRIEYDEIHATLDAWGCKRVPASEFLQGP